jgi:hypothetical protein
MFCTCWLVQNHSPTIGRLAAVYNQFNGEWSGVAS